MSKSCNFPLEPSPRSLREKVEAKRVLVCSTGAVEKNIDIVIGRRFTKHGMSWIT